MLWKRDQLCPGASTSPGESNVFNIPALSISPEQSHRREDEDLLRRAAGDAEEELQLQGAFLDSRTLGSHPEQVRQRARPSERSEERRVGKECRCRRGRDDCIVE